MTVDRLSHAALLIVDMQNDFVRVGAPLEVPQARETITVHRELIAFCRERDIPVLYTKFVAGPGRTLIWEWSPVLAPPGRTHTILAVRRPTAVTPHTSSCSRRTASLAASSAGEPSNTMRPWPIT